MNYISKVSSVINSTGKYKFKVYFMIYYTLKYVQPNELFLQQKRQTIDVGKILYRSTIGFYLNKLRTHKT